MPLDLTSCDQEPIHLLGAVQPFGFLLAAAGPDGTVRHVSANCAGHLGLAPEAVLGRPVAEILQREALHQIRGRLQGYPGGGTGAQVERIFGLDLLAGPGPYDVAAHRLAADPSVMVLEAEPSAAEPRFDPVATVKGMIPACCARPARRASTTVRRGSSAPCSASTG